MNNLTGHEKLKRDCVAYFRQNEIWQRIFTGFREKYSSYGRFSGKVTVKNISGDGLDTLEGFFCQNFHGKKSITVSAEKFRKALSCSKYGTVTPEEVLAEYFGKALIGKAEEKAFKENQIREIKKEFLENFKGTPAFLEFDTFENILKSSGKENLKEWKRLLWLCANLYNALPYRTQKSVYLAVFAAAVTGNPHAFDNGTAAGNFLYQMIQMDLFAKSGIRVYYAGDLDPEGILIAQKLSQYYKGEFHYWHMETADYEKCRSEEVILPKRMKILERITDGRLKPVVDRIEEYGTAGYQEMLVEEM